MENRAFTLIELLVVIAIILILIAIALPNFLEAQVRAKITRMTAEHRTLMVSLESYRIDFKRYPRNWVQGVDSPDPANFMSPRGWGLGVLTTPNQYIKHVPFDLFRVPYHTDYFNWGNNNGLQKNSFLAPTTGYKIDLYQLRSYGPDAAPQLCTIVSTPPEPFPVTMMRYSPTNGTVSPGDIIYWGPNSPARIIDSPR